MPAWPAAALSVAATLLSYRRLHEDGLADTADGFGGGRTREQKLDIMRDSRIGAYGVCALVLSLLLRVGALASLADAIRRGLGAALPRMAPRARRCRRSCGCCRRRAATACRSKPAGRRATASPPASRSAFLILVFCLYPARGILALIFLIATVALMAWLSMRQIDGQTGDVVGALEQVSEIAILLVAVA